MKQNNRKAAALFLSQNGFRLKGVDHSRSYPLHMCRLPNPRKRGESGQWGSTFMIFMTIILHQSFRQPPSQQGICASYELPVRTSGDVCHNLHPKGPIHTAVVPFTLSETCVTTSRPVLDEPVPPRAP